VHDAPTRWGRVSYAVRWHGDRPALLWELEPHHGLGPVQLTVPGLDSSWSTTEPAGDALLAALPDGVRLFRKLGFSEVAIQDGLLRPWRLVLLDRAL